MIIRDIPGVTIRGVTVGFSATEDTHVGQIQFDETGITGVAWRKASMLDPSPPKPPATKVLSVALEFDGVRVETGDPAVLANLDNEEWRKAFAAKVAADEGRPAKQGDPPRSPGGRRNRNPRVDRGT